MTKFNPNRLIQVKAMWKQSGARKSTSHTPHSSVPYEYIGVILADGTPAFLNLSETNGLIQKTSKESVAGLVQYGKNKVAINGKGWVRSVFSASELRGRHYPKPRVPKSLEHLIKTFVLPSKKVRIACGNAITMKTKLEPVGDLDCDPDGEVFADSIDLIHVLALWKHYDDDQDSYHVGAILSDGMPVYFSTDTWYSAKAEPSVGAANPHSWVAEMEIGVQWVRSHTQEPYLRSAGLSYGTRERTPTGIEFGALPSLKVPLALGYLVKPDCLHHVDVDPDTTLKYVELKGSKIHHETTDAAGAPRTVVLHRIVAVRRFETFNSIVDIGDHGGFIENLDNLSHEGRCWIDDDAYVFDEARVSGDAQVFGWARISGTATVNDKASVSDNAVVKDSAQVYGNARVRGNAKITGGSKVIQDATVKGSAFIGDTAIIKGRAQIDNRAQIRGSVSISGRVRVFGDAVVENRAQLEGSIEVQYNAYIGGNAGLDGNYEIGTDAFITDDLHVIAFAGVGSENGTLTAYRTLPSNFGEVLNFGISVTRGCFNNTLEAFEARVEEKYSASKGFSARKQKIGFMYRGIVNLIRYHFSASVVPPELQVPDRVYPTDVFMSATIQHKDLPDAMKRPNPTPTPFPLKGKPINLVVPDAVTAV